MNGLSTLNEKNTACPWCKKEFKIMDQLRGFDVESKIGKDIIWFHIPCGKLFKESNKVLITTATGFDVIDDPEMN